MLMGCSGAPSCLDSASLDLLILLFEEKCVFFSRLTFALCCVHQLFELHAEMCTGQCYSVRFFSHCFVPHSLLCGCTSSSASTLKLQLLCSVRGPKDPEAFLIDPNRNSVTIVGDNGFLTVHDFLVIQQWGEASVISADFQLDQRSILK